MPEDLIRLCVGIEDGQDLLDDLQRALVQAGAMNVTLTGTAARNPTINDEHPAEGKRLAAKAAAITEP